MMRAVPAAYVRLEELGDGYYQIIDGVLYAVDIDAVVREKAKREGTITIQNGTAPTVYGYPLNEIIAFANLCRRHEITEDDLHDFCTNAVRGYEAGRRDFHITWMNAMGSILGEDE
jgi:hypothetical protein